MVEILLVTSFRGNRDKIRGYRPLDPMETSCLFVVVVRQLVTVLRNTNLGNFASHAKE